MGSSSFLNPWIISKSCKPVNAVLSSKPSQLALCVLACRLLDCSAGFVQRNFVSQNFAKFPVADEIKWLCIFQIILAKQLADFVEPAARKHCFGTSINAVSQGIPRWLQTKLDGRPSNERLARGTMNFRDRLLREEAYFNGADNFLLVGGRDFVSGFCVQLLQNLMEMALPAFCCARTQPLANFL